MTDVVQVDGARNFVARVHGEAASVVDYEGNGFCWGWSLVGSAFPHALQHGAVVAAAQVQANAAVHATPADLRLETQARRQLWSARFSPRYKRTADAASTKGTADNDFFATRSQLARVQRRGGWCGSAAINLLADMIGLDYVVVFDARTSQRAVRPRLMVTNVRAAGTISESAGTWDATEASVRKLRADGLTRGAYLVVVPDHYFAVQVGRARAGRRQEAQEEGARRVRAHAAMS